MIGLLLCLSLFCVVGLVDWFNCRFGDCLVVL